MHWSWGVAELHTDVFAAVMWYSSVAGLTGFAVYLVHDRCKRPRAAVDTSDDRVMDSPSATYTEL